MLKTQTIAGLEIFSCLPDRETDKPSLLFVHGAFAGGWMWTETFMPFLAQAGYPCHALSLRGHGGSEGREHINWHSVADYVDDLKTVTDWLGEEPVLIGHSMGGFIVQKYLEHRPAQAVALICSVPPQGLIASQFHLLFSKPHLFLELNRILSGEYTDTATLREALFAGDVDEAMLAAWMTKMQNESQRAILDMTMFNLPNLFSMHRPPMLIVGAEDDVLVPAFLVQTTASTYGQRPHIFRRMGHAVTHEKEWPLVAACLRDWLEELKP
ncbi:alpha/beta hydrolase [Dechloromonas sp. ARDL1]|uniref:alpha/beta hydrolase n=1 Tax=Dechloromonas sp. ARDL1 TaxID=3322121 RepID=UPI003DA72450